MAEFSSSTPSRYTTAGTFSTSILYFLSASSKRHSTRLRSVTSRYSATKWLGLPSASRTSEMLEMVHTTRPSAHTYRFSMVWLPAPSSSARRARAALSARSSGWVTSAELLPSSSPSG